MLRLLITPRWLALLAFAVVLAALCLWASHWQWGRYQYKLERRHSVAAFDQLTPIPLSDAASTQTPLARSSQYRLVQVRGTYNDAQQVLVRNPMGRSGFAVLTPLVTAAGDQIFVNRGWVPSSLTSAAAAPEVPPPPSGQVTAVLRLHPPDSASTRVAPPGQSYNFDVTSWAQRAGTADSTFQTYGDLVSQEPAQVGGLELPPPPDTSLGPHLLYSVQWVFFAGFALVGFVLLLRREASVDRPNNGVLEAFGDQNDNVAAATSNVADDPSTSEL